MTFPLRIYNRSPWWLQNAGLSVAGWRLKSSRYGSLFQRLYSSLRQNEYLSRDELLHIQFSRLQAVCKAASLSVRYYRSLFQEVGFNPDDFTMEQYSRLIPILTKDDVRRLGNRLVSEAPAKGSSWATTSGTTGKSLSFLQSPEHIAAQWATWWRHRARVGLRLSDSYANFGGRQIVSSSSTELPVWRRNLPMRQTYFSVSHLTDMNLPAVCRYLSSRRFDYISGYPSALSFVSSFMLRNGIRMKWSPRAVVTGSEGLLAEQRSLIQKAMLAPVSEQYGLCEGCANISECELGSYHVDMDFSFVELIPFGPPEMKMARIVGSNLYNTSMPLLRYDTGDIAISSSKDCPCGRTMPTVRSIDGRREDVIHTPDGRHVGRLSVAFKSSRNIHEAQVEQLSKESVLVRIVKLSDYGPKDESILEAKLRDHLGPVIGIDFEYVDRIPREPSGKFRAIVGIGGMAANPPSQAFDSRSPSTIGIRHRDQG